VPLQSPRSTSAPTRTRFATQPMPAVLTRLYRNPCSRVIKIHEREVRTGERYTWFETESRKKGTFDLLTEVAR
jgi:hypothetical protein